MNPKEINNENLGQTIIKELKKRNMEGYYCIDSREALKKSIELIKDNSVVSWGGSLTLTQIGLQEELKKGNYTLLDRSTAQNYEEAQEIYYKALNSDYYFSGTNAITLDGKLINVDANGNRIAALIYGPKNVIVVVGINKVVADEDSGIKRVRNIAAPPNSVRLNLKTPCVETGKCHNCLSSDCICCQTLITRMSRIPNRIKVIIVGEELGY